MDLPAVQLRQPVAGKLSQPRIKRERPVAEIIGQLLDGLGQGVLDHVGRINAAGQPAIHAQATIRRKRF